ncbi:MAG: DNA polymerase III subunit gamma/tau [Verrucomicrobiia bacterium]
MSYQVIARKYRPQRFSDVVGQEHVTQTLANAIQKNRIAHAYLFVGPRGTGKTTVARIFAKCLNCTGGPKVDFADDDPRCQEIAEGRALDVLEIDGASNRGIEEVRELRETVKYAPATSRFKIYIIDEVHMLTKEAFNALLKTLEEPPPHVKFMFATTEPEKVLPTILSRCQRFDLRRIPAALIVEHLTRIAKLENVTIDEPALYAVARGADGGMRDAQSALDQLISFCGAEIAEQDVLSMFGLTARGQIFSLAGSMLAGDSQAVLRELDDLCRKGKDLARLLADLLNYLRNLLLFQVTGGDLSLLDVPETEARTLAEQSKSVTADALTRMMDILSEHEGRLRDSASKRILVEVALLKAIQARAAVSIDAVLQKLQALRQETASEAQSGGGEPPAPARTAAPTRSAAAQPGGTSHSESHSPPATVRRAVVQAEKTPGQPSKDLAELWTKVAEAAGQASPFIRTYLSEAHPVSLVGSVLTIGFGTKFADHLSLVDTAKTRSVIQAKLQELGIAEAQVRFTQAEPAPGWVRPTAANQEPTASVPLSDPAPARVASPPPTAAAESQPAQKKQLSADDFKNDPLIKQALEIFKGQIIEARA